MPIKPPKRMHTAKVRGAETVVGAPFALLKFVKYIKKR
jgi:hypothetical protein